jgi:hypothetical protein
MKKDIKILKYLYHYCNDGRYYDVSIIFDNIIKNEIDEFVIQLERNNFVEKQVEGYLSPSALTAEEDISLANNSVCKITKAGIEYIENFKSRKRTNLISITSLIIAIASFIYSFLK